MDKSLYADIRKKAAELREKQCTPLFYKEKKAELNRSEEIAEASEIVQFVKDLIIQRGGVLGHGHGHAEKVAIEAGALVYCERGINEQSDPLTRNILVAGYLHDICRNEKEHPQKGAHEAELVLKERLSEKEVAMVAFAIKSHEAFKKHEVLDDDDSMLLANALYDADKFRWGPDNFTYTIWDMAESMKLPLEYLVQNFERGVGVINDAKDTFRTNTGRKYGPEFIDIGLKIGEELFQYLLKKL